MRPSWSWSTRVARCSARCRPPTSSHHLSSTPQATPCWPSSRRTSSSACPTQTSRPTSCATGPGGPAPRCSSWSTTTTWRPAGAVHRCRRSSPCWHRHATSGSTSWSPAGRAVRPGRCYEPVLQSLRDLAAPGLVLSGSPDEGALIGAVRPAPAPPGRGRWVTRDVASRSSSSPGASRRAESSCEVAVGEDGLSLLSLLHHVNVVKHRFTRRIRPEKHCSTMRTW